MMFCLKAGLRGWWVGKVTLVGGGPLSERASEGNFLVVCAGDEGESKKTTTRTNAGSD